MAKKTKIGIDEVGRGPLAGPVVAVAVRIKKKVKRIRSMRIKDSKKTTPRKREELHELFIDCPEIEYGVGVVSEKIIDKINILEATKIAMQEALKKIDGDNMHLIIDGNFTIKSDHKQKAVKKADESVLECQIASIIAKVERDKIMDYYHEKYPQYGFNKHKGYGTKKHRRAIEEYGPCTIHRKSFKCVL